MGGAGVVALDGVGASVAVAVGVAAVDVVSAVESVAEEIVAEEIVAEEAAVEIRSPSLLIMIRPVELSRLLERFRLLNLRALPAMLGRLRRRQISAPRRMPRPRSPGSPRKSLTRETRRLRMGQAMDPHPPLSRRLRTSRRERAASQRSPSNPSPSHRGVGVGLVTVMRHCKFDVGESSNIRKVHYLWVSLDIIQRKY